MHFGKFTAAIRAIKHILAHRKRSAAIRAFVREIGFFLGYDGYEVHILEHIAAQIAFIDQIIDLRKYLFLIQTERRGKPVYVRYPVFRYHTIYAEMRAQRTVIRPYERRTVKTDDGEYDPYDAYREEPKSKAYGYTRDADDE